MIFLIGRHGSGKSTIASHMVDSGYQHLSIGMLRRLARSRNFPSDVPAVLMSALARAGQGPLPMQLAQKIISFAASRPNVIVDGLPASVEHLSLIPSDAIVGFVWAPKNTRHERLIGRAELTVRQWIPGRISEREESLPSVVHGLRKMQNIIFINNSISGTNVPREIAVQLLLLDKMKKAHS